MRLWTAIIAVCLLIGCGEVRRHAMGVQEVRSLVVVSGLGRMPIRVEGRCAAAGDKVESARVVQDDDELQVVVVAGPGVAGASSAFSVPVRATAGIRRITFGPTHTQIWHRSLPSGD